MITMIRQNRLSGSRTDLPSCNPYGSYRDEWEIDGMPFVHVHGSNQYSLPGPPWSRIEAGDATVALLADRLGTTPEEVGAVFDDRTRWPAGVCD